MPQPHVAEAAASSPPIDSDSELCVVCMDRPREAGFVHGKAMHLVVCNTCVELVAVGSPCTMRRVPVEHIVSAIYQ